jgi:signal transduction histidine kinase
MKESFFSLDYPAFWGIMLRFAINLVFLFFLIRVIYFRYSKKEKYLFTFFLMGITIFFICSLFRTVFMELSFAFGIFAVFAILRFRTSNFNMKDMAYIFTTIGVSVMNSLKLVKFPFLGILIINTIIVLSAFMLEEFQLKNKLDSHLIIYEDLELLKPDKKAKLLKDLSERTGKNIMKIKIRRINYKRNIARLEVFYYG